MGTDAAPMRPSMVPGQCNVAPRLPKPWPSADTAFGMEITYAPTTTFFFIIFSSLP